MGADTEAAAAAVTAVTQNNAGGDNGDWCFCTDQRGAMLTAHPVPPPLAPVQHRYWTTATHSHAHCKHRCCSERP